ncbi:hypothetical protein N9S91_04830 [Candidatus Pelagibacter sp.]|nr:hypothetical protein [Candidatus Pelagibacter sp.]
MKPYLEVELDRFNSHKFTNKSTVHRSSLMVPRINGASTSISFLNHFLLKRNLKDIVIKVIAIDQAGNYLDDFSLNINEPKVYYLPLDEIFDNDKINNFLIEFFTAQNLFIPYPAVMINHQGKKFHNVVHSYNRILNDVFEDDKINSVMVPESGIDIFSTKNYETFVSFATGQQKMCGELGFEYNNSDETITKKVKVDLPRLSHKSFILSEIFNKSLNGGVIKIQQPQQSLFYGRMFWGIKNTKTNSFSANHSYYSSTEVQEYFDIDSCYRTYPYFKNFSNKVVIYPIMSPSEIYFQIKITTDDKIFYSKEKIIISPSGQEEEFDINEIVNYNKLENITAFTLIGKTKNKKIPSRVNHQVIYGSRDPLNKIKASINTSMSNKKMFFSQNKEKIIWGQIICDTSFTSKLGFVFMDPDGNQDIIDIDIYNEEGFVKNIKKMLKPSNSVQISHADIKETSSRKVLKFYWYTAKSSRQDLTAFSFHCNNETGESSGEHSF